MDALLGQRGEEFRHRWLKRLRICLFCQNGVSSREDLWPQWLFAFFNPGVLYSKRGQEEEKAIKGGWMVSRCVCRSCNNGWMSRLESAARPLLGPLISDVGYPLSIEDQKTIARWAVKTAMVFETVRSKEESPRFYLKRDCELLCTDSFIPIATSIWIGRYGGREPVTTLGADVGGPDESGQVFVRGYVTTFSFGHLAMQVLSLRHDHGGNVSAHPTDTGPWSECTVQIWPTSSVVKWPPHRSFYDQGPLTLRRFDKRWGQGRIGVIQPSG